MTFFIFWKLASDWTALALMAKAKSTSGMIGKSTRKHNGTINHDPKWVATIKGTIRSFIWVRLIDNGNLRYHRTNDRNALGKFT